MALLISGLFVFTWFDQHQKGNPQPGFLGFAIVVVALAGWWTARLRVRFDTQGLHIGRPFAPALDFPIDSIRAISITTSVPLEGRAIGHVVAAGRAAGARWGNVRAVRFLQQAGVPVAASAEEGLWLEVELATAKRSFKLMPFAHRPESIARLWELSRASLARR